MHTRIEANPADDDEFVRTVRELARRERSPRVFEADLRTRYPRATVRNGQLSGRDGQRWYVYRDGRWDGDGYEAVAAAAEE